MALRDNLYSGITVAGLSVGVNFCSHKCRKTAAHALKVLIAASLAESKHIGSRTWGDADDRVKATNLALLATDRDTERAEALINEMIGEARNLVEHHWSDIEKLAEQLLVEGRVNFLQR